MFSRESLLQVHLVYKRRVGSNLLLGFAVENADRGLSGGVDDEIDDLDVRRSRSDVGETISDINGEQGVKALVEGLFDGFGVLREVDRDEIGLDETGRNERHTKRGGDDFSAK